MMKSKMFTFDLNYTFEHLKRIIPLESFKHDQKKKHWRAVPILYVAVNEMSNSLKFS